ncbi:MAG: hypothetical protein KC589_00045 [Nanoarchaeota archaeon]|nr:hypothetical protein [Nanoarchaeota archaeon]
MEFLDDLVEESVEVVEKVTNERIVPNVKIKYPWEILDYLSYLETKLSSNLYSANNLMVGGQVIHTGLVICGDNVMLGDYAYVRGPIIFGDNVKICAEVKNSVILSGTKAVHRNIYIGDSVIGRDCNFGAGSQTANLRFDEKEILVKMGSKKISSGRKKLGLICGHRCKFGVNSSISPGKYVSAHLRYIGNKTS